MSDLVSNVVSMNVSAFSSAPPPPVDPPSDDEDMFVKENKNMLDMMRAVSALGNDDTTEEQVEVVEEPEAMGEQVESSGDVGENQAESSGGMGENQVESSEDMGENQVESSEEVVGEPVQEQVGETVEEPVGEQVEEPVGEQVGEPVEVVQEQVGEPVQEQVGEPVERSTLEFIEEEEEEYSGSDTENNSPNAGKSTDYQRYSLVTVSENAMMYDKYVIAIMENRNSYPPPLINVVQVARIASSGIVMEGDGIHVTIGVELNPVVSVGVQIKDNVNYELTKLDINWHLVTSEDTESVPVAFFLYPVIPTTRGAFDRFMDVRATEAVVRVTIASWMPMIRDDSILIDSIRAIRSHSAITTISNGRRNKVYYQMVVEYSTAAVTRRAKSVRVGCIAAYRKAIRLGDEMYVIVGDTAVCAVLPCVQIVDIECV